MSLRRERPLIALTAFAALGVYGLVRWGTLLAPAPTSRLIAVLVLSLLIAVGGMGMRAAPRSIRLLALVAGAALALLALFPLAGLPLSWTLHLRIGLMVDRLGQGLGALPRVFVPYAGVNEWVREVIVLGAGGLLAGASLLLAFGPRGPGDLRRAAAAMPLIVLAVLPMTLLRPRLPYLQGLLLFVLVAALVWGERLRARQAAPALLVCVIAAVAGSLVAPGLAGHRPWVNYQAWAGGLSGSGVDAFDWSQRYGPIGWPRKQRTVLEVRAARPEYWKAQDLDFFDGRSFASADVQNAGALPSPDPGALARWTQTLEVTIRSMHSPEVIAAGFAARPARAPSGLLAGQSPGTWVSDSELGPGDSYQVKVYAPEPTPSQLAAAGGQYPAGLLGGYLSLTIPGGRLPEQVVAFPPFGSPDDPQNVSTVPAESGGAVLAASPYARAFALARSLAAGAPNAYAYAASVERFLAHGYAYSENPPARPYPLASFLFQDRAGYCQQFAGAMALLLRMGGVPARVAAGFTTGNYDSTTHSWVVTDLDAHAWVEAWFPHYGWVRFDPTPASDPARGGNAPLPLAVGGAGAARVQRSPRRGEGTPSSAGPTPARRSHASSSPGLLIALVILLMLAGLALLGARKVRRPPGEQLLLAEVERAFARTGRPLAPEMTLAALERRFGTASEAGAYIRAIRLLRFADSRRSPDPRQRRALRAQLRAGLGLVGALRALWALPPRPPVRRH